MKIKTLGVVQIADKEGKVTEHKPGTLVNVDAATGARLIDSRHAEAANDDVEDAQPASGASNTGGGAKK